MILKKIKDNKLFFLHIPLPVQVLIGLVAGVIFGLIGGSAAEEAQILGEAFIRLIEMVIIPLLFPLIVLGVSSMKSMRQFGRLGGKTIIYFEVVTTIVLIIAAVIALLSHVGEGANLSVSNSSNLANIDKSVDLKSFALHIIPSNIISAFGNGNIISLVFFGIFFGIAMSRLGDSAKPLEKVLINIRDTMFYVINIVIKFAPIGVFGAIAYTVSHYGFDVLGSLLYLIGVVYFGLLILLIIIFPLIAKFFGVSFIGLMKVIGDLILISFSTRSSESVLAPIMQRLEEHGINNSVVSFVIPLGYSFNLAGSGLYITTAVVFLANGYDLHMSLGTLAITIGLLVLLTKGLSGVPSASIVVLLATASAIGLPTEGVALLIGIDFILDMARTAVDTFGTPLASVVIAKSEKLVDKTEKSRILVPNITAVPQSAYEKGSNPNRLI
jgi:proton glutamate symport protein